MFLWLTDSRVPFSLLGDDDGEDEDGNDEGTLNIHTHITR